jgi:hypothetical protein
MLTAVVTVDNRGGQALDMPAPQLVRAVSPEVRGTVLGACGGRARPRRWHCPAWCKIR